LAPCAFIERLLILSGDYPANILPIGYIKNG